MGAPHSLVHAPPVLGASLSQLYLGTNVYPQLGFRAQTFQHMLEHLERFSDHPEVYILETGTSRQVDNWQGDGQSTLLWDWAASLQENLRVISVDIDPAASQFAGQHTRHVQYHVGNSVPYLNALPESVLLKLRLLYLDSMDWNPEKALDSCFHHMAELAAIWAKIPSGCMIAVDDCHGPSRGKHAMVEFFMAKIGIPPAFQGYQTAWIKP